MSEHVHLHTHHSNVLSVRDIPGYFSEQEQFVKFEERNKMDIKMIATLYFTKHKLEIMIEEKLEITKTIAHQESLVEAVLVEIPEHEVGHVCTELVEDVVEIKYLR